MLGLHGEITAIALCHVGVMVRRKDSGTATLLRRVDSRVLLRWIHPPELVIMVLAQVSIIFLYMILGVLTIL